jgi:t-SNARE complex subunit (syntaxin)
VNKIKKFVSKLLKDYFNDTDKKELIEILTTSLEEKVEDLVEQGTPIEEAIDRSIKEFGSTEDVLDAFSDQTSQLKSQMIKNRKSQFSFSIIAYLIIVGLVIFLNLTFIEFFKNFLWFVIVAIGLLFWPTIMAYRYYIIKK